MYEQEETLGILPCYLKYKKMIAVELKWGLLG